MLSSLFTECSIRGVGQLLTLKIMLYSASMGRGFKEALTCTDFLKHAISFGSEVLSLGTGQFASRNCTLRSPSVKLTGLRGHYRTNSACLIKLRRKLNNYFKMKFDVHIALTVTTVFWWENLYRGR
jgi:hypothetical protein